MKKTTLDQLKSYGTMSAAFLAAAPLASDAAPVYFDPVDVTISGTSLIDNQLYLDIDGNSISATNNPNVDVRFNIGSTWGTFMPMGAWGENGAIVSNTTSASGWGVIPKLAKGASINNIILGTSLWANNGGSFLGETSSGSIRGNWTPSPSKGFFGVKFNIGGNPHYGWVRVTTTLTAPLVGVSLTVHDFAYESIPNTAIAAGAGIPPTISLVDANGDGIPDITDPCSCADFQNITDGTAITYFHDFIEITSSPGETWEVSSYNSGGLYASNAVLLPIGTVIPEISPGVYYLDVWHADATGFDADFDRTAGGGAFTLNESNACLNSNCANVPTLSTWGLISMSLFLMSFGSIVLIRRAEYSFADKSTEISMGTAFQKPPINWSILSKTILATIALAGIAGAGTLAVYGTIAMVDVIGTMIAGPILAYLMHLMIIMKKEN